MFSKCRKGEGTVPRDFYPFVEKDEADANPERSHEALEVHNPARIAVYDDASAAPRVVMIEPCEVRDFLEQITGTVNRLSHEQGGTIPFMVIRELVENFIHAYFQAPTITILDGGNTIRFSDQGPGIPSKDLALEYGTSSATEEMKHYIRGVGSGLPYVQQYMADKGGSLEIEDNIAGGTVVTISTHPREEARAVSGAAQPAAQPQAQGPWQQTPQAWPQPQPWAQQPYQQPAQQPYQPGPWQQFEAPSSHGWPSQQAPAQTGWPQQASSAYPYQPASTSPFLAGQPMAPNQAPSPFSPAQPVAGQSPFTPAVQLDERSEQVLSFLADHEMVGPTELVRAFGSSAATWSRALSNLGAQGLVMKVGQKYQLTAIGRTFV